MKTTILNPNNLPQIMYRIHVGENHMITGAGGVREFMNNLIADGISNYDIQSNFVFIAMNDKEYPLCQFRLDEQNNILHNEDFGDLKKFVQ